MEDSFEARLAGQKPVTEKKKSGKGWMICSIITLVLLIGVGTFAGILFFNKGDDGKAKIAELEKTIKEKDEKIEKCEETPAADTKCDTPEPTTDTNTDTNTNTNMNTTVQKDVINIDFDALKNAVKQTDSEFITGYTDVKIMMSEDGKYIIADGTVLSKGSGWEQFMYKENKAGSSWKELYDTQAEIVCSSLNQTQKNIFHGVTNCMDDEGHYQAL